MKNYETMSVELIKFESQQKVMIDGTANPAPAPVKSGVVTVDVPGTAVGTIN